MSSKLRVFQDEDEYLKFCEENEDRVILVYQEDVLDVTDFLDEHPGGADILEDYNNQDITEVFHSTVRHVHSHRAIRLLSRYKIGYFKDTDEQDQSTVIIPEKQWTYPIVSQDKIEYKEFKIDLRTGLASQISKVGKKHYTHVLHSPVELPFSYKVHNSSLLNTFSPSNRYIAPVLWAVILFYMTFGGAQENNKPSDDASLSLSKGAGGLLLGICLGTLVEYLLNRFFFFAEDSLPDNQTILWLHFAVHGKHQICPSDQSKIGTPLWFQMAILFGLYSGLSLVFARNFALVTFWAIVLQSMIYELTHYQVHSKGNASDSFNMKNMQQYHTNCHNRKGIRGFGLTTKIWDKILGTETDK